MALVAGLEAARRLMRSTRMENASTAPDGTTPQKPLGRLVASGLRWSFFRIGLVRAGTLLTGIVLARLLTPRDFGVFAVALVAYYGVTSFNELGVSLAIVRWPGDVGRIAPTVSTLAISSSTLLYGACFVAAPWFASALGAPEAANVVRLMCLGVLLDGLAATPSALLQRTFRQDRKTVADLANFVIGAIISIVLATHGAGAWSLAWGRVVGSGVGAALYVVLAPARQRPGFDRMKARELLAFGLPLAGASLLVFAVLNIDYVVVGTLLGPVALGFYVMAFNLSSWPVNIFSATVRTVSLPGFSRLLGTPAELPLSFARSLGWLMAVTLPVCVMLAVLALPLVRFVYGHRWAPAAAALTFLAILAAFRTALELVYDFLVAAGKSRTLLGIQAAWLASLVVALPVGARLFQIRGVAAGHALVVTLAVAPLVLWRLRRVGVSARQVGRSLARPVIGSALVGVVSLAAQSVAPKDFLRLALAGLLSLTVYAIVMRPMLRKGWRSSGLPPAPAVPRDLEVVEA
jgi:O-antigen/teichoic acid export membrane protein